MGSKVLPGEGNFNNGRLSAARVHEMGRYILEIWSQYLQKRCQDEQHLCFVMFSLIIDKEEFPG